MMWDQSTCRYVVLCIDDFDAMLRLTRAYLERHGYYVLTAASGDEGLEILKQNPVDLLVVDYDMPRMDGGTVAREVRRLHPNLPIVLMSVEEHVDGCPVDAYVPKFEISRRLLGTVGGLLHNAGSGLGANEQNLASGPGATLI